MLLLSVCQEFWRLALLEPSSTRAEALSLIADGYGPLAPKRWATCLLNVLGTDKPNCWGSGVCSDPSPVFYTVKGKCVCLLSPDALAKVLVSPSPTLINILLQWFWLLDLDTRHHTVSMCHWVWLSWWEATFVRVLGLGLSGLLEWAGTMGLLILSPQDWECLLIWIVTRSGWCQLHWGDRLKGERVRQWLATNFPVFSFLLNVWATLGTWVLQKSTISLGLWGSYIGDGLYTWATALHWTPLLMTTKDLSSLDRASNIWLHQGWGPPSSSLTLVLCSLDFVQDLDVLRPGLHRVWAEPVLGWWASGLLKTCLLQGKGIWRLWLCLPLGLRLLPEDAWKRGYRKHSS